jgi:hypothetical protein
MIDVTHFTDPGCPWAYSASPALATLRWRYGDQLRWTLVTIGLAEDPALYAQRGSTPLRSAMAYATFRRSGMPFQVAPKARLSATSPACRAVVATRLAAPELEDAAFRALVRYTAPSLIFETEDGRSLEAGQRPTGVGLRTSAPGRRHRREVARLRHASRRRSRDPRRRTRAGARR